MLDALKSVLKPDQISTRKEDLATFGKDWSIYYPANASAIVFPESHEDVVEIVKWARAYKVALVPSGGRTGLSSAATASNQEVVIAFDRMNKILSFDESDLVVTLQPGVITETLQEFAEKNGYFFPIDFAAKGSSQVGGNVATNAGGVKVVKYGLTRQWVAGLKVVTGAGESLYLNKSLKKNATGYDLRQLFIGSEGTLGFITEIEMLLAPAAPECKVLVLGIEHLENALAVYREFNKLFSVTACEFFSHQAMEKVLQHHSKLTAPFETQTPYYLLLELENTAPDTDERLETAFSNTMEKGWVLDGVISQNSQQAENLWSLREYISESLSPESPYKNDVSVRISRVPEFVQKMQDLLQKEYPNFQVIWFGHIGDGNVHINILKPKDMEKADFIQRCQQTDALLYEQLRTFDGSISAEHGVGLAKKKFLHCTRSPEEIQIMKEIKKIFDPDHIINPGKIF
ncbi:MAG: FAD-binding oxidoreductase [Bdellovibrionales bacterium]|nr:FAD-binding oxidoreductase [Bdellovibrionales bacterium]